MEPTADRHPRRSPLNTVVGQMIRIVAADPDDRISQLAVAAAVDELVALDDTRPESWYLEGLVDGFGLRETERHASEPTLERRRLNGMIDAAVEARDEVRLAEIAVRHAPHVHELIATGAAEAATAAIVLALLPHSPERAIALAAAAPRPFPGWEIFVTQAEKRAAARRDAWGRDRSAVITTSLAGVVAAWRSAGADEPFLESLAARLDVARATMHREAGDFEVARRILAAVDEASVDNSAESHVLWLERALTSLRLSSLDAAPVTRALEGDADAFRSVPTATRVAVARALAVESNDPAANLLAGVLALAEGTTRDAAIHLEAALDGLDHRVRPSFRTLVQENVEALRASVPTLLEE